MCAKIVRSSLHNEILSRLRDMIVEGRWQAGERIPELQLCEELGVSRTPLREALKVIASEGIVELLPNRGAVVRAVSVKEAEDMLDLMGVLEAHAGRLACSRATPAQIDSVVRLHETMMRHYDRGERHEYFELNQSIHDAIVALSDNVVLIDTHRSLSARMKRLRFAGSDNGSYWRDAVAEHQQIIQYLRDRDGDRLAHALQDHQRHTWVRIRDRVRTETEPSAVA